MHPNPKSEIRNPKSDAFTLLELILALAVASLLIGTAALSIGSLGQERHLRGHAGILETTARGALQSAIQSGNPISLLLSKNSFSLGEKIHPLGSSTLEVLRTGEPAWRSPSDSEPSTFHPHGLCEPLAIRISDPSGSVEIHFDPLTAAAATTHLTLTP